MKLHPLASPMGCVTLLAVGLLSSQTALAITIPVQANCYNGDNGYDVWIANNSAFGTLSSYNYYNNGTAYYTTGTGTFQTTPPTSVPPLNSGSGNSFCFKDKKDFTGNWLAYELQGSDGDGYIFQLQFWGSGDDTTGSYYLNLQLASSDWTTSGTCPGETNFSAPLSAVNTSSTQTFCSYDFIVNIVTTSVSNTDVGVTLSIMDNPAGTASGSQGASASADTASTASSRSVAAESGRYGVASRIFNKTRWSVIRNPETLALSGMSYAEDGLQHGQFLHCTFDSDDGNVNIYRRQSTYQCQVAEPCTAGNCGPETWRAMTEAVTIPGTFFDRPPAKNPEAKPLIPPVGGDADIRKALELLPTVTERKIHQTPDGKVKVISVNLLKQEWLLTYDGRQLFAAVPHNQMGQPRFVHCQQTAATGQNVTMACAEAYRCMVGPCTDDQWARIGSVTLPQSLLSLPITPTSTGGGGCVLTPNAPFDPLFPALTLGAVWYLSRRRRQS